MSWKFLQCVCNEFRRHFGTDCNITLDHVFSVENNPTLQSWCKLQARELGFDPDMYSDMNHLPVGGMKFCDILIAGTSCKSLSTLNTQQRSLADVNPDDALCSSGNTMNGDLCQIHVSNMKDRTVCKPCELLYITHMAKQPY